VTRKRRKLAAVDVTGLLQAWRRGDAGAAERLLPLVYAELRRLARGRLRGERAAVTFQPTVLVQEAFLRLIEQREVDWRDRSHFFAIASTMMRRILIDHARARARLKRAHEAVPITIETALHAEQRPLIEVLDLDRVLEQLAAEHPRHARIVELRFFAGLEMDEIAEVLAVSDRTVKRDWAFARAWMLHRLEGGVA
jgi:RNA polymerase sigma factor (TIGR02999 family)